MARTDRILKALPATATELAAIEQTSVKNIHATLCYLRGLGLAHKTDRHGERHQVRGPRPFLWDLTPTSKPQEARHV